jgi:hypothetical protein
MTWTLTVLGVPVGQVDFVGVGFVSKGFVDWLGLDLNLLTKQQLQRLLPDGDVTDGDVTDGDVIGCPGNILSRDSGRLSPALARKLELYDRG